jgi:hypothetical protein
MAANYFKAPGGSRRSRLPARRGAAKRNSSLTAACKVNYDNCVSLPFPAAIGKRDRKEIVVNLELSVAAVRVG